MIALGSIHGGRLIELVQLYGAKAVREAITEILLRKLVDDPSASRHRQNYCEDCNDGVKVD